MIYGESISPVAQQVSLDCDEITLIPDTKPISSKAMILSPMMDLLPRSPRPSPPRSCQVIESFRVTGPRAAFAILLRVLHFRLPLTSSIPHRHRF